MPKFQCNTETEGWPLEIEASDRRDAAELYARHHDREMAEYPDTQIVIVDGVRYLVSAKPVRNYWARRVTDAK